MYSVVLATMLTAGAQTTTWGWHRCHGCSGCHGVYTYNAFSCHGCSGCASFCGGGSGWCHGCSGRWCHGCHGCSGVVVVLGGCHGCHGCHSYGCHSYSNGCSCNGFVSCHCSGFVGCHCNGGVVVSERVAPVRSEAVADPRVTPRNDAERKAVEDALRKVRESKGEGRNGKVERRNSDGEGASVPATKARVVVRVPADARLWVDQVECPLPGTVRSFDTPELNPEQNYTYTLRIALQRNGQVVEDSRRIQIVPGRQVEVDFSNVGAIRTVQN
jgi:uncharacterized protein (TIGR03000 family)